MHAVWRFGALPLYYDPPPGRKGVGLGGCLQHGAELRTGTDLQRLNVSQQVPVLRCGSDNDWPSKYTVNTFRCAVSGNNPVEG